MDSLIGLVVIILAIPLIKGIFGALSKDVPKVLSNSFEGLANASDSFPTMGAEFSAATVADSLDEVQKLKAKIGCTDNSIVTIIQLTKWMSEQHMF